MSDASASYLPGRIPGPPAGRSGWPWGGADPGGPSSLPDGSPWPRVTIVTPSYNQGSYLEECIRSVLLQGYPNLEYIVMDGGSSDESVGIIQKYSGSLTYWVSQPDRGQSDALSRGFALSTGELLGWLNSDDLLAPNALQAVVAEWRVRNRPCILTGQVKMFLDGPGGTRVTIGRPDFTFHTLLRPWLIRVHRFQQPGSVFRRDVYESVGGIDVSLYSAMDYDLYARMLAVDPSIFHLDRVVAHFRMHVVSKTSGAEGTSARHLEEHRRVTQRFRAQLSRQERRRLREFYAERGWYVAALALVRCQAANMMENLRFALSCGLFATPPALIRLVCRGIKKQALSQDIALFHQSRFR